jgi:hypothetical protein
LAKASAPKSASASARNVGDGLAQPVENDTQHDQDDYDAADDGTAVSDVAVSIFILYARGHLPFLREG